VQNFLFVSPFYQANTPKEEPLNEYSLREEENKFPQDMQRKKVPTISVLFVVKHASRRPVRTNDLSFNRPAFHLFILSGTPEERNPRGNIFAI